MSDQEAASLAGMAEQVKAKRRVVNRNMTRTDWTERALKAEMDLHDAQVEIERLQSTVRGLVDHNIQLDRRNSCWFCRLARWVKGK